MSAPPIRVDLWSEWPGAVGASPIGELTVVRGSFSEALDNTDSMSLTVARDARVVPTLGAVVVISIISKPHYGFRISSIDETIDAETIGLRGLGPFADLNTRGLVRSVSQGLTEYAIGGRLSPADIVDTIVLPSLVSDAGAHWTRGTIDPTLSEDITAPATGWSPSEWLRELATRTGAELRVRIDGLTSLVIDLFTRVGSTAPTAVVESGVDLLSFSYSRSDADLLSAVTVLSDVPTGDTRPASIGENAWVIGTVPGVAPYWIPLTDPAGGAGPVAFASQFGTASGSQGAYLLRSDAGTTQITDSRTTPDNAVLVAATTGLTAGHHVQIVADSSANRLSELRAPNTIRRHRTDRLEGTPGGRNLVRNGTMTSWAAPTTPNNWTAQGGTCKSGQFARTSPATFSGIVTNGSTAAGAASISLRGFTPGDRLWLNESFAITGKTVSGSPTPRVGNDYVEADGSGHVTITFLTGTLDALTADGTAVTMFTIAPKRPTTFPTEPDLVDVLRLLSAGSATMPPSATSVRLQSDAFTVKYIAGPLAQVNVAAAFTMHNGNGSTIGNLDAGAAITEELALTVDRRLPGVMLRNNATAARLAYGIALRQIANNTTQDEVVTCSATLTADTTIDICLLPAFQPQSLYASCRYITASLGPVVDMPPVNGAWDTRRWQRANRLLLSRGLTSRQVRITMRELALMTYDAAGRNALTLGGMVRLPDLGEELRVVSITYDLADPGNDEVLLDTRPVSDLMYFAETF